MRIFLTFCVFDLWLVVLDGHMDPKDNIGSWDDKTKKAHSMNDKAINALLFLV